MTHKYALAFALTLPLGLAAQTDNYPNGSTVSDFTVTDVHGQVHNLNTYAAAGKHVLLDFFFYGCGPCQQNAPHYSQLYQTYGCNGGDLICIEINNGTDSDAQSEAFSVDFAPGFAHPPVVGPIDGDALTNVFGVTAFPTFALISPEKVMLNHDIYPISNMNTFVNAFPAGSGIQPMACVVGIRENKAQLSINTYPSPTTGPLTLNFDLEHSTKVTIDVIDGLGQVVSTTILGQVPAGAIQRTLDLGTLPNGPYLLRINTNELGSFTPRIGVAH